MLGEGDRPRSGWWRGSDGAQKADGARQRVADVRERDRARLMRQMEEGLYAGLDMVAPRKVEPEPLTQPEKPARPLNPEAQDILSHETEFSG